MTGKLVYLGPQPERAAGFKLLGNLFLMFVTAGLADILALAKALDIPPDEAATLFDNFNPAQTLGARIKRMLGRRVRTTVVGAGDGAQGCAPNDRGGGAARQVALAVLPAIAAEMDRFIARGHGDDDWTIIASDALTPKSR